MPQQELGQKSGTYRAIIGKYERSETIPLCETKKLVKLSVIDFLSLSQSKQKQNHLKNLR